MPANQRCAMGIGRSFQIPKPFEDMTVFENLLVAAYFGAGLSQSDAESLCVNVLDQTGLLGRANDSAGTLSLLGRNVWSWPVPWRPNQNCCCSMRLPVA